VNRFAKLMAPLAIAVALCLSHAPARAQADLFGGGEGDMMTTMAPMLEMMKKKMGKKRFTVVMQTMGPMVAQMGQGGGFGGFGGGGFGGGFDLASLGGGYGGGFDMSSMSGLMSSGMIQQMTSMGGKGGRKGKRARR
jgi:hypothetical protein